MTYTGNMFAPINRLVFVWYWLTRYQVIAADGRNEYAAVWWAKNEADALEWARAYKPRYSVVYGKRGKLLGGRRGV